MPPVYASLELDEGVIVKVVVAWVKPVEEALKVGEPENVSMYQKLTVLEPLAMVTEVVGVFPASE